ncbi:cytochrome bd-I oxidase subunit CydX [Pigmentiphaga sp. NML080357]|nr:cytochrome bd-I oxidase subunit CydX [Pigmentiphaga sp. NML080357]
MWYFSWILGLGLAAAFAVLNAMWYELMEEGPSLRAGARPPGGGAGGLAEPDPPHSGVRRG